MDETPQGAQRGGLVSLIAANLKVGAIGFGGGSALIPVMESELVHKRRFLDEASFTLHTVVANITPGALPVKLAAMAGARTYGAWASLLCALAVALPGTAATVGLVAAFDQMGPDAIRFVEFAAVGITAFIIVLLVHYISKVLRTSEPRWVAVLIMLVAWAATGANETIRLVALLFGAHVDVALPSLSAVGLILTTFAAIGLYSFLGPKPSASRAVGGGMAEPLPGAGRKLRAIGVNALVLVAGVVAALLLSGPRGLEQLVLVALSTVTSFGGGEAYVGVADGFFVAGGLVSSEVFYGQLVPVANALPGPILVKIASGIGYSYGSASGGPALGLVFALTSFLVAIAACCAVVHAVILVWGRAARSTLIHNLGRFILPVICGLLLTTSVSMVLANAEIAERGGAPSGATAWGTLIGVVLLIVVHHRFRPNDLVLLAGAGAVSLTLLLLAS